jgi:hypothetical protein
MLMTKIASQKRQFFGLSSIYIHQRETETTSTDIFCGTKEKFIFQDKDSLTKNDCFIDMTDIFPY